jgi:hypothetical protein
MVIACIPESNGKILLCPLAIIPPLGMVEIRSLDADFQINKNQTQNFRQIFHVHRCTFLPKSRGRGTIRNISKSVMEMERPSGFKNSEIIAGIRKPVQVQL